MLYTLNRLADDGHCYATRSMLIKTGAELLAVDEDVLHMTLDEMIRNRDVITEKLPQRRDRTRVHFFLLRQRHHSP